MQNEITDEWLFEVEDVFDLSCSGLGLVMMVNLSQKDTILKVGATLTFLCPDGQEVATQIKAFPMINTRRSKEQISLELSKTEATEHIAAGSRAFRHTASN